MNFPLLENISLNIILTKAAGVPGLQGGGEWGRDPQLPLPTCTQFRPKPSELQKFLRKHGLKKQPDDNFKISWAPPALFYSSYLILMAQPEM